MAKRHTPTWDPKHRKLLLGRQLVKRNAQPAVCQELILAAFHEQDWAEIIDDPLPRAPGRNPKDRLRNTVKHLNRGQSLVHFFCCNNGRGVGWQLVS